MLAHIIWFCEQGKTYKDELLSAGLVSFLTFVAGSFYDYFYRGLNPFENPAILIPLVISVPFLSWWCLSTDRVYHGLAKELIKSRFRDPKIAIIFGKGLEETEIKDLLRATVYTPEIWLDRLRSNNLKADITIDLTMKNDFSIILNPFGELYPEEDITNLKTFQRIKTYVKKGGVFVNTAGLAFFYMWNPKTKIEGLTGPMLETYSGKAMTKSIGKHAYESSIVMQPIVLPDDSTLIDTWLYRNFGIRTTLGTERSLEAKAADSFDDVIEDSAKVKEFRSALRCESPETKLIPVIRSEYVYQPTGRRHECYPIAAVRYGIGYSILIGMILSEEKDLLLVLRTIQKIIEKLRETGSLEENI